MTEQKNPFDPKNFIRGGGLWDGKVVTITGAKAIFDKMPFNDENGEPVIKRVVEIRGLADGDEAERKMTYLIGSLQPTADGEGFLTPSGAPAYLHQKCEAARFFDAAVAGGFDFRLLFDEATKRQKISGIVGARFLMKSEAKTDQQGNVRKNKKGYDQENFFPVKFEGWAKGVQTAGNAGGNGAVPEALKDKATETVVAILSEAGGTVGRADLVRKIGAKLAGDSDVAKIIALITKESFHQGAPWTRDGTGYSL